MRINYNCGSDIVEITVKDSSMRKIDFFRVELYNKKEFNRVLSVLKSKYNFTPSINPNESVSAKEKDIDDLDIRW